MTFKEKWLTLKTNVELYINRRKSDLTINIKISTNLRDFLVFADLNITKNYIVPI